MGSKFSMAVLEYSPVVIGALGLSKGQVQSPKIKYAYINDEDLAVVKFADKLELEHSLILRAKGRKYYFVMPDDAALVWKYGHYLRDNYLQMPDDDFETLCSEGNSSYYDDIVRYRHYMLERERQDEEMRVILSNLGF